MLTKTFIAAKNKLSFHKIRVVFKLFKDILNAKKISMRPFLDKLTEEYKWNNL